VTSRFLSEDVQELVQAEWDVRARIGDQPFDFAAMAAISNIYRAANVVRNHMEQKVLADYDLSWGAFTVVFVLWIWGEQETRHLAAEAGVTKGTLTGVLKTLEARGYVRRHPHPDDGRLVVVRLEPAGRTAIEGLFPRFNEHEAFASSNLSSEERNELATLLRVIIRTVQGEPVDPS
jgi:DNA-binding MarR family transcriptional regulator